MMVDNAYFNTRGFQQLQAVLAFFPASQIEQNYEGLGLVLQQRQIMQRFARIVHGGALLNCLGWKKGKQRERSTDTVGVMVVFEKDKPAGMLGFLECFGYRFDHRQKRV
jgi:hypothetical protein